MITTVELGALVASETPICYGILMPGAHTQGGVPVIKVRDFDTGGIDVNRLLHAEPRLEAPFRRSRLEPGDILLSIRGTTGAVATVPPELAGANITQDTARIRVAETERAYLYQALQAPAVQRQIRLHTIGQAVKGINIGAVRRLAIPWPPKRRRDLIGRILSACDAQSRVMGRLLDAKRIFKRGLMRSLVEGEKRFAKFDNGPWACEALSTLVEPVSRRNTSRVEIVLSATGERGLVNQRSYFKRSVAGDNISNYYLLKRGEFAYNRSSMKGYPFGATKRLDDYAEGVLSTLYTCFRIRDAGLDSDFVVHLFESGLLDRQLRRITKVGGRAHGLLNVTASEYFAITIPLPSLDEQRRISQILNDCAREIGLLERLRHQLEIHKSAIFARLLSGQIAVPA